MNYGVGGSRFSPTDIAQPRASFTDFLSGIQSGFGVASELRGRRRKTAAATKDLPEGTLPFRKAPKKQWIAAPQPDFSVTLADYLSEANPFLATGRAPY